MWNDYVKGDKMGTDRKVKREHETGRKGSTPLFATPYKILDPPLSLTTVL